MTDKRYVYTDVSVYGGTAYISAFDKVTNQKVILQEKSFPNLTLFRETSKESKYKSLVGNKSLEKIDFESIADYKNYLKDIGRPDIGSGLKLYGDYSLDRRWISSYYGDTEINFEAHYINVGFWDIETIVTPGRVDAEEARNRITSMVLYATRSKTFYIFSDKKIAKKYFNEDPECTSGKYNFKFFAFTPDILGEYKMIKRFFKVLNQEEKIDVLSAYFGNLFDFPYIYNRLERLLNMQEIIDLDDTFTTRDVSPLRFAYKSKKHDEEEDSKFKKREVSKINIKGIQLIDYFEIYKKYTDKKPESWKLDHIAELELGKRKVKLEGGFMKNYNNDYDKYVYYNYIDVKLLLDLDTKLNFLGLHFDISYICKENYEDSLGTIKKWESIFYTHLYPKNIILNPSVEKPKRNYLGGYTHEPIPGIYYYPVSFDLNSLYPHLVMQYYVSPETIASIDQVLKLYPDNETLKKLIDIRTELEIVSKAYPYDKIAVGKAYDDFADRLIAKEFDLSFLKEHNLVMTPSIEFFRKDENAIFPYFMDYYYSKRKIVKNEGIKFEQIFKELSKYKENSKEYKSIIEHELAPLTSECLGLNKEETIEFLQIKSHKLDMRQLAFKILLNSGYGVFGNNFFRFFDMRIAKSITAAGRLAIRSLIKHSEEKLTEVYEDFSGKKLDKKSKFFAYSDTDSCYYSLMKLIPCVIYMYKNIIKTSMKEFNNIDLTDDFFEDITTKFEEKTDPIIKEWFKPHDMMRNNGLLYSVVSLIFDKNDAKEMYAKLTADGYNILYRRKGNGDTVHCFIKYQVGIEDELKKKYTNIKKIFKTSPYDDFLNYVVQDIINENFKDLALYMNAKQKMVMKRESICINAIWVGKKNYILNVVDKEGVKYDEPKIKITGIIKSTAPKLVRNDVKNFLTTLLSYDNIYDKDVKLVLDEHIDKFKTMFMTLEPQYVGISISVNDIDKHLDEGGNIKKGCPIQSSSAIAYNNYILKHSLIEFEPINEGEKMKYFYLKDKNKFGLASVGCKDDGLPEAFWSEIDMDRMLEKGYYSLYNTILKSIDLDLSYKYKTDTIEDLFGL